MSLSAPFVIEAYGLSKTEKNAWVYQSLFLEWVLL